MWARPWRLLAFGLGVGLIRPGSGTWGSVLGLLLWWPLERWIAEPWLAGVIVAALLLGVVACGQTAAELGVSDHVGIVWDEIACLWLLLWLLPDQIWLIGVAFVLFRCFDVAKPWPIGWLDRHGKGGLGIMLDDLVAALYAAALLWMGWWGWQQAMGVGG